MAQQEHNMITKGIEEEHVLAQATGSQSSENNAAQGQSFTYLSNKRKCFACQETSHTLDQCSIKERLVAGAQPFAHSTRQPFYMIQPSEEAVEKEKLYRHCLQITSDISNLDLRKVKVEVSKFWKLTDWEIRTKDRQNFLVSFNSEDDLISCLETPRIETSIDDKEVSFTVARWKEEGEEHMDLIREWFLVYGVPRIYRNWKELYQIASAVRVLIDVDEESLEGDNKEPVKLKVGLRGVAGAPFSCHFAFGWYSRWITFMIEDKVQNKDKDCNGEDHPDEFVKECKDKTSAVIEIPPEILNKGMNSESSSGDTSIVPSTCNHTSDVKGCSEKEHEKELETLEPTVVVEETNIIEELRVDTEIKSKDNISAPAPTTTNCEKKVEDNPRAEREQSTSGSSTSMVGDALFKGILAHQQVSLQKLDEEMNPESRNHTAETAASTDCNTLNSKSCLEKDGEKEMKMAETTPIVKGPKSAEEFGGDGEDVEINVSSPAATVIQKTTEGSPKAEKEQSTSGNSTGMIGEAPFRGIQKPPIKIVYARRNKRSMEKQDSKCFIEKEHRKEMEAGLVGQGQKSDNGVWRT